MKKFITRLVRIGDTLVARDTICPMCGKRHVSSMWVNIICNCGSKYYINTTEWLDRNTGVAIKVEEQEVVYVPSTNEKE